MWILKKWIVSVQQERIIDSEYCKEYLKSTYIKKKNCYSSVKKSKLSLSFRFYIDKKIHDIKEDPRRKTDSNFIFFQAT